MSLKKDSHVNTETYIPTPHVLERNTIYYILDILHNIDIELI